MRGGTTVRAARQMIKTADWSASSNLVLTQFTLTGGIASVDLTADGSLVAVGCKGGKVGCGPGAGWPVSYLSTDGIRVPRYR